MQPAAGNLSQVFTTPHPNAVTATQWKGARECTPAPAPHGLFWEMAGKLIGCECVT